MLIVDVPEGALVKNPAHVRDLKDHDRATLWRGNPTDRLHEGARLGNVFKRHPATDEVDRLLGSLFGEVLLLEDDIG